MLAFFSLTLFVSATLLFLVQPMIGKMILPRLGGTPAVWNTCMAFFQAVLLVGYAYTHTISTWQARRRQLLIQSVLLLVPFVFLPFSVDWDILPTESNPVFHLLWLLLGVVGLPFFVVSTSAPLLQKWFATTGHPAAKDPYFLYGASNFGSMLALVLYPLVVEPLLPLEQQAVAWTVGYGLFVALVWGCALLVLKTPEPAAADRGAVELPPEPGKMLLAETVTAVTASRRRGMRAHQPVPAAAPPPDTSRGYDPDEITLWRRLRWVGLAAVPSSLMLGVTTYLTTDIAAVPFFWVIPLALYLLTFILVFARWPVVWTEGPHGVMLYLQPCLLLFLVLRLVAHLSVPTWGEFTLHILAFFSTTLVCHGELAKDRPTARHLTEFYLWMSVGGVVGGLFNALFAPVVMPAIGELVESATPWRMPYGIFEYPLAMVLACLLRPNLATDGPLIPGDSKAGEPTRLGYALDFVIPLVLGGVFLGLLYAGDHRLFTVGGITFQRSFAMATAVVLILALAMRPLRFGLAVGLLFLVSTFYDRSYESNVFEGRGFFGLVRVREGTHWLVDGQGNYVKDDKGSRVASRVDHTLIHGGINHGQQIFWPEHRRRDPMTYFHPTNGVSEVFQKMSLTSRPSEEKFGHFIPGEGRFLASVLGQAADPYAAMVALHSQPPFAVVGLGSGTLAVYAMPGQHVDFYEIDPMVKRLSVPASGKAEDLVFTYVDDAVKRGAHLRVILGDGRLMIDREGPEEYYHAISLDAFSSDAIPVHLLTDDAVKLYLRKLAPGGVLVFNATNRYVRIEPVLSAIAERNDLECLHCPDYSDTEVPDKYGADWVVLRRRDGPAGYQNGGPPLKERVSPRWQPVEPLPGQVWTDSYSNLLRVMRW